LYRPAEVEYLVGSPRKAEAKLGWRREIALDKLVAMMSEADERRAREGSFVL
ncbi:MAG: GDP-mannose 4,6-dehydratase, partial [Xanthobacteraceae bacterium]|nr:GDP-mannose 4,6-dehydratase [Xanthobacteraceae bacterium]